MSILLIVFLPLKKEKEEIKKIIIIIITNLITFVLKNSWIIFEFEFGIYRVTLQYSCETAKGIF